MKMKYVKLSVNTDKSRNGFENARWHVINYILKQGDPIIREPNIEGINRPSIEKEEFGLVAFHGANPGIYSFYIEPKKRNKNRNLQIVIGCGDDEELNQRIIDIKGNNTYFEEKRFF